MTLSPINLPECLKILKSSNVKPSDALHIAVMKLNGIMKMASEVGNLIRSRE